MSKTTNSKLITKKLQDSVFGRNIYLVCGPYNEARSYISERFKIDVVDTPTEEDDGLSIAIDGEYVIWVDSYEEASHWHAIVAHECLHTTYNALTSVGIEYCEATEEVYTYYMDSLVKQITKIFLKK